MVVKMEEGKEDQEVLKDVLASSRKHYMRLNPAKCSFVVHA